MTDLSIDADWDELYVDGEWRASESGETIAVEDPSTRETVTEVPSGTEADVDAAYEAAAEAQEAWGEQPLARRQAVIEEFHEALNAHADEIIELLEYEVGGSAIMGETSIQIAADHAGEAATLPRRMKGEHAASNTRGKETQLQVGPKGVVAGLAGENPAVPAMGLGGNSAHVVTVDPDLDRALNAAASGSSVHQGRVWISINRHVVHENSHGEYVAGLVDRAESLPTGGVHDAETIVGPIIDESQRDGMLGYVDETAEAGATLETGGRTVEVDGVDDSLVVAPTVLSGVTNDVPAAANEHFGPIAPVIPFSDVDEAVEIANDTEYGLSGAVHSGNLATAKEIADRMETGNVHINDQPINDEAHVPFSGIGASGVGHYNSDAFLSEITETKWVSIQHEPREYPF